MTRVDTDAYYILTPEEGAPEAPVFFDSPHSGKTYPNDFNYQVPFSELHQAEDAFVDEMYETAPKHGCRLLAAKFPRSYIDANRNEHDFDPREFEGEWTGHTPNPTVKTQNGEGLIWLRLDWTRDIYEGKLTVEDIKHRIDTYWRPYHAQMVEGIDRLVEKFGYAYHINCHSMPNLGLQGDPSGSKPRADFVLGDRDGTTCEPGFTNTIKRFLESRGYSVAVNDPYKGVELVERYSDPAKGRHSMQLEINRRLYMDEQSGEKIAGFTPLKDTITALIPHVVDYAKSKG